MRCEHIGVKENVCIYEKGGNRFSFIHMLIEVPKIKAKTCELIDGKGLLDIMLSREEPT